MAWAVGTTHSFVNTVWRSVGLKPHLWRTFEKRSVHALDRTQPGLPLKPCRCETLTHNYKRHRTKSEEMLPQKCS